MPDVLDPSTGPALSATSDMPVIDVANALPDEPVDKPPEQTQPEPTSAEPEGEADGEPPEKETAGEGDRTPPAIKAQISRARNAARAAEQRNAELQAMLQQALQGIAELTKKPEPTRPLREHFNSPEAYDEALMTYAAAGAAEKAKAEAQVEQQRQLQESRLQTVRDTYVERAQAFAEDHPDYHDLVDADDVGFTLPMTAAIAESEDGPAVAYHLAQHPEQMARIAKLTPAQQVYEIGKVAARISNPPPRAPRPIPNLGARTTAEPASLAELDMDAYAQRRAQEDPEYARYAKARERFS